jgi:death-on-curing protein
LPPLEAVSVEDLLSLHDRVVNSPDRAAPGLRDPGALEAAAARPQSAFGGVVFYPTPFAKAAALMESIIQRHPFVDGNKRTGLLAAAFSLDQAGYELESGQHELADVAVEVADHHLDVDGLTRWLEEHAQPWSEA